MNPFRLVKFAFSGTFDICLGNWLVGVHVPPRLAQVSQPLPSNK